jgi:hypothetical protein
MTGRQPDVENNVSLWKVTCVTHKKSLNHKKKKTSFGERILLENPELFKF